MKLSFLKYLFLFIFLSFSRVSAISAQTTPPLDDKDILEEEILPEENEDNLQNEEEKPPEDEGLEQEPPPVEEEPGTTLRTVTIDGVVNLSYVFENSPDSFEITYRVHIKGDAAADTAILKGDAEIKADVKGYLAQWPGGQCKLEVTISNVPFELVFKKVGEETAAVNLQFKGKILENWQSKCEFKEGGKSFDTSGPPEKWLTEALQLAAPPLTSVSLKFDEEEIASTTFQIREKIFNDPPIGSVQLDGTGVVTVKPKGAED